MNVIASVSRALQALIDASEPYQGLFPSLLDRHTGAMLTDMPPPIEGQRNNDRSHLGSNLMHDQVTLKTLYALAEVLPRPGYRQAADRYLRRFSEHCTNTATGLFPWGEHSFWHLTEDRVGNSYVYGPRFPATRQHLPATHDHLRQAPRWLWETLWEFNPQCVEGFAEGLDFHWVEGSRDEYIRHASIEDRRYPKKDARSCDFPRHGGFYIFDWAYAWQQTGRQEFLEQIRAMLDYWWEKRDDRGLLLIESRSPADHERFYNINAPGQTVSLAASLLESAQLAEERDPELAGCMRQRAAAYIDGFFAAPHDLDSDIFVMLSRRDDNTVKQHMPIWGSQYGLWPASYVALTCLCAYRLTDDQRLLEWASAVGRGYLRAPFPTTLSVPAMDAGLGLGLLADLYDITDDKRWLAGALELAGTLRDVYLDAPLPRGAAGIDWYESQMGPGFLLHALARTTLLAEDVSPCPLQADYTAR